MSLPQINITDIEHQQALKEATKVARMEIINNLDQESRENIKKQEVQVYMRKNLKQPTTDQPKSLEVLPPKISGSSMVKTLVFHDFNDEQQIP
jgi:hypothetical protein